MAIPKFLEDLLIISKLGDNPGSDNGLSSSGLRAKFDEAGVKIQQYINNTLIPALSELADPTAGLNMKGNISMGGYRVTGLGEPVENGDAVPLGYAGQHFAPAGYGLGGFSKDITGQDLNNIIEGGRYWFDYASNDDNDWRNCYMEVIPSNGHSATQILYFMTSYHGCTLKRVKTDWGTSAWGEWEWENPPMMPNTEYRTTKRHNGQPVYTMLFPIEGNLPNASSKSVSVPSEIKYSASAIISTDVITDSGAWLNIVDSATPTSIWIITKSDYSAYTANMVVEYVK